MQLMEAITLSRIGMAHARGSGHKVLGTACGAGSHLSDRKARKRGTQVRLLNEGGRIRLEGRYEQLNRTARAQVDALEWEPIDPDHPLVALARTAGRKNDKAGRPAPERGAPKAAKTDALALPEASDGRE